MKWRPNNMLSPETEILEKLNKAHREAGLSNRDLAFLLDVSDSYLCNIRKDVYLSPAMRLSMKQLTIYLTDIQRPKEWPLFQKLIGEGRIAFRNRKNDLLTQHRHRFQEILNVHNIKEE